MRRRRSGKTILENARTVVYSLRDHLENSNVSDSGAAVIPVVFELLSASLALGPFERGEFSRGSSGDKRHDCPSIEREDRGVHVDVVRVQDLGQTEWRNEWTR